MEREEIEAIRARAEAASGEHANVESWIGAQRASAQDVPALLAEIERLRDAVNSAYLQRDAQQVRANQAERERDALQARLDAVVACFNKWTGYDVYVQSVLEEFRAAATGEAT